MLHAASPTSFGRSHSNVYGHPATSSTSGSVTMFDSNSMMDQDHDAGNFYYVQEPRTKRHHEGEDMFSEYAPRQKRKFDRISERFQNFSISKDAPLLTGTSTMDTSSDEEFDDGNSPMGIVQEPEEEDEPPKKIRIDEKLKAYLERARQAREPFLPRLHHSVKGDEVAVWRPTGLRNPFDDPSMQGRISEIEEPTDEEDWQDGTILVYFLDKTFFPHLFEEYKVLGSNILFVEKP
ncbi:hypothetical protein WR25_12899 [Diploscapter pachys]|uniref:Uncharacterized protein n=1 Tax=Diploscapter pachys TaxID=2018661 RepID=A0A2A2LG04_9BILA|nr:hypothetical protein WR25_12899 [Diploscapter pachys]